MKTACKPKLVQAQNFAASEQANTFATGEAGELDKLNSQMKIPSYKKRSPPGTITGSQMALQSFPFSV